MNNYIFFLIINFLLFFLNKKISKTYNLFDNPDNLRKLHKKPVPLLGGLYLIVNLILFYLAYFYLFNGNIDNYFFSYNNFSLLVLGCMLVYILGFCDDKYQLGPNIKFIMMIIILLIIINYDKNILLTYLEFTFHPKKIILGNFSYFITILCFLLFINAFNMLDGINGQAIAYTIYIFLILISYSIASNFLTILIICLIFILVLNLKNKTYLGNSGSLLLGFLIAYIFIKSFNFEKKFYADEIFLIMSIPGFELLRLAIQRIINNKHPFKGDNNHIHHLILKKQNFTFTFFLIQIILIMPFFFFKILNNFIYSFILSLIIYTSIIYFFSKNQKDKR